MSDTSGVGDLPPLVTYAAPGGKRVTRLEGHARCVNHEPASPSWKTTAFSPVSSTRSK